MSELAHLLSSNGHFANPLIHGELFPAAFGLSTSVATDSSVRLVDTQSMAGRLPQLYMLLGSLFVLVPTVLLIGIVAATTVLNGTSVEVASSAMYIVALFVGFLSRYTQAKL
ncbi:MAG TPA: hypothetical protein VLK30_03275 [Candidatus Limnocylindrales bacterium]|nr:hypothetical protein [Candidatus Limnocylindrales bacterium]